jgi:hypothetical protein
MTSSVIDDELRDSRQRAPEAVGVAHVGVPDLHIVGQPTAGWLPSRGEHDHPTTAPPQRSGDRASRHLDHPWRFGPPPT